MRLKKVTAKNGHITYSIIKDYIKLDGKRTSTTYELLGDNDKLKERFGKINTMDKVQEYIDSLNQQIKDGKEPKTIVEFDPNKRIEKGVNRSFYSGHLFLRKIYYLLGIDKICETIKENYKFEFDINKVVECLVFARIVWPSSKLSTFEQSRKFIGNYDFDLQHVYRTLTYLSKEINNIQKQLFDYSNKVINRNYKVIYYDCTNFFFYTEENDFQRNGISKQHMPLPLVQMGLFMDADGYPFAMNINPGNTSETKTMIPSEEEFLKEYNMKGKNVVVCTDAAMCTDDIKKYNVKDEGLSIEVVKENFQKYGLNQIKESDNTINCKFTIDIQDTLQNEYIKKICGYDHVECSDNIIENIEKFNFKPNEPPLSFSSRIEFPCSDNISKKR